MISSTSGVKDFIYQALDLSVARATAQQANGWTAAAAATAEQGYRDFLWVCWNATQNGLGSLAAIGLSADEVWHAHMQQPVKYLTDCQAIFGPNHVLDHDPAGQNGFPEVTAADRIKVEALYRQLNLTLPGDLRYDKCVWAVVQPTG
jgi:hypothetical protein